MSFNARLFNGPPEAQADESSACVRVLSSRVGRRFDTAKQDQLAAQCREAEDFSKKVLEEFSTTIAEFQTLSEMFTSQLLGFKENMDNTLKHLQDRVDMVQKCAEDVAEELDNDAALVDLHIQKLEEERNVFDREVKDQRAKLDGLKSVMTSINKKLSSRFKLNIGGRRFDVSTETLCSEKDSFFEKLVTGEPQLDKDDDGCVFIDRDGYCYEYVFNFLRDGDRAAVPSDKAIRQQLLLEAEFLNLPGLERHINQEILRSSSPTSSFGPSTSANASDSIFGYPPSALMNSAASLAAGSWSAPHIAAPTHETAPELSAAASSLSVTAKNEKSRPGLRSLKKRISKVMHKKDAPQDPDEADSVSTGAGDASVGAPEHLP